MTRKMRVFWDQLIWLYQTLVSSYNPPCCRFMPSCSWYAREAIDKYGWYGLWLTLQRLARCHPWSKGGVDEVPPTKKDK